MAIIPDSGLVADAKILGGLESPYGFIAVGSGTGAEEYSNTALTTEITDGGLGRVAVTPTYAATAKMVWHTTFTATATRTITEMGLFNTQNSMGARILLATARNLEVTDTFEATIQKVVTRGAA